MNSHEAVRWTGNINQGQGTISTDSGALQNIAYSVAKRFEGEHGTNPEELVAAAHAACYSMALSAELSKSYNVKTIDTSATVTLDKSGDMWTVTSSHLDSVADIEGINTEEFDKIAQKVKQVCPISRLLNTTISLEARLASDEASQTKDKTVGGQSVVKVDGKVDSKAESAVEDMSQGMVQNAAPIVPRPATEVTPLPKAP